MNRKTNIFWLVFIVTPVVLVIVIYLSLAYYYKGGFNYGTWINNVYCTGKSVEEINTELLEKYQKPIITVQLNNGISQTITTDNIDYQLSFTTQLQQLLMEQNPYEWVKNMFISDYRILLPEVSFNQDKALVMIDSLLFIEEAKKATPNVVITLDEDGYHLLDTTKQILDTEHAKEVIYNALSEGESQISLLDDECYYDASVTEKMHETYELWYKIQAFQDFHFVYQLGNDLEDVDEKVVCDWIKINEDGDIVLDENGDLILDETMVRDYIASLASKYDTLDTTRQFMSTRGDLVTIEGGTYGNRLDQETEYEYLLNAYKNKSSETRIPEYEKKTALYEGSDDIGNTYIEIDMTNQIMYYYKEGIIQLETPVVTGNTSRKMGTPARVCYVYGKQKNRILRGPNYAAHVNYWMPVNGNIGIHDAKWRDEFGGEIYKTDGSHGCINTPYDAMSELYEMVEIGTPVVMFY